MGPVGGCGCSASGGEVESRAGVGAPGTCAPAPGAAASPEEAESALLRLVSALEAGLPEAQGKGRGALAAPPGSFTLWKLSLRGYETRAFLLRKQPRPGRPVLRRPADTRDLRCKRAVTGRNPGTLLIKRGWGNIKGSLVTHKFEI